MRTATGKRHLYPNSSRERLPIWISTSNYYFLVLLAAAALFVTVAAALYDGYDDTPWIVAGVAAGGFVISFILLREILLRRFHRRAVAARRLSQQLGSAILRKPDQYAGKLTLQRNEELLRDIRAKSEAAKVLGKFADAHKEVFDLCEDYLVTAAAELSGARPGSPRIPALRKGSKAASGRHRFHMLKWAEIKARSFISEAGNDGPLSDKVAAAQGALNAVDRAMEVYPDEAALADSRAVLSVFLVSARVRDSIDKAEKASALGSNREAADHYREALADLQKCDVEFSEREAILKRIRSEIGRTSRADV